LGYIDYNKILGEIHEIIKMMWIKLYNI